MLIYKITNIINNKVYIGKTEKSLSSRIAYHIQDLKANRHCNRHLQSAYNKYGINCFKFENIDKAIDSESLNQLEKNYITLYLSTNDKFGYNLTNGGDGTCGWKATEETRKRMSDSKKGVLAGSKHPQFGKKMLESTKIALMEANKKRVIPKGKDNPRYGKKNPQHSLRMKGRKLSAEHIAKISAGLMGKNKGKKPHINCIEASRKLKSKKVRGENLKTLEIINFNSMKEAADFINGDLGCISQVCLGHRKTHKNWKFSYLENSGG